MNGLEKAFTQGFASELPMKEEDTFDLDSEQRKKWANAVKKNKKAM